MPGGVQPSGGRRTMPGAGRSGPALVIACLAIAMAGCSTPDRLGDRPVAPAAAPAASAPGATAASPTLQAALDAGDAEFTAGRFERALAIYLAEVPRAEAAGAGRRASLGYRIGVTLTELRRFDAAERSLRLALDYARTLPAGNPLEISARQALGALYRADARPAQARVEFAAVLAAAESRSDRTTAARAHAEIASTWLAEGSLAKALADYALAEDALESSADPDRGRVLVNIGSVYTWLGRYDEAIARETRGADLCRVQADDRCVAAALHAESFTRFVAGDPAGARDAARQAVALIGPDVPVDRARALNNLGLAQIAVGATADGLSSLEAASALLQAAGTTRDRATVVDSLGTAFATLGDPTQATARYLEALGLWRAIGDLEGERDTLGNLGVLMRDQGRPETAVLFLKLSVDAAQRVRGNAAQLPEDLQRSLLKRLSPNYQILAGLLIDQGRLAEAQQVVRMLKEQELHEFLRGGTDDDVRTTRLGYDGDEQKTKSLYDRAAALFEAGAESQRLRDKAASDAGLSEVERARRKELDAVVGEGRTLFQAFVDQARTLERRDEPRDSVLPDLAGLQGVLRQLGAGAVILQYLVLPDQVKILLTAPLAQRGYTVPIDRTALYDRVWALREAILGNRPEVKAAAARLTTALVPKALDDDLRAAGAQTLMVSFDGALRYLPFGVLHDGERWMAERYDIVGFREVNGDAQLLGRLAVPLRVRAFGMTQAAPGFVALGSVRSELEGIVRPGADSAIFDAAFDARALEDAIDRHPPVLHLATHFSFLPGTAEESFLLLGDRQKLSVRQMQNFAFDDVDLITLSACDTATTAGPTRDGKEIESFASLMQQRGAHAVLATLWPVDDGSTAQFMIDFYAARRATTPATKAEAFRLAQRRLMTLRADQIAAGSPLARGLTRTAPGAPFDAVHPYAHPFYWAPFVLIGNWR